MTSAGIFLKGNVAHIVTLEGKRSDHSFVDEHFDKLEMEKNPSQKDIAALVGEINAYIKRNNVKQIVLNRRVTAGQMAGAAGTFIWEGVLLATSPVPLIFVHAATVRSTDKKQGQLKKKIDEENVPRAKAYDFSFEGLK